MLLVPLLCAPIPPLTDYPNHLARAWVLVHGAGDPVLRRMFAPNWALIPNLATDLLLPPLMRLLPPLLAGRVVIGLALLLPVTGAVALGRACFQRRSWWPFGAAIVATNTMFLIGTLNFQLSVGVALWGAACWQWLCPRHPVLAALTGLVFAVAAYFAHLFGFAFYALLIGCMALDARDPRGLAAAACALAPPGLLYFHSAFATTGGPIQFHRIERKFTDLLVPVLAYSRPASLVAAAVIVAVLVVWWRRGQLLLARPARLVFPILLIVYAVLPVGMKGGYWVDTRIPVLLGFALFALVAPSARAPAAAAALGAVLVLRSVFLAVIWVAGSNAAQRVRAVLAGVPPGSAILVVDAAASHARLPLGQRVAPGFGETGWHAGMFAVIDRRAYASDVFALPGQQPLRVLPPYDRDGDGGLQEPPRLSALSGTSRRFPYLADWPRKYNYVLVLHPQSAELPPKLPLIVRAANPSASLYAVLPEKGPGAISPSGVQGQSPWP